jgi:hypothetical protein
MGGVQFFKKSINFGAEGSCMGAPLCSRIATFFVNLHTSHRFDPLYTPFTTSYHLLHPSLESPLGDPLEFWGVKLVVNSVVNSGVNSGGNLAGIWREFFVRFFCRFV